MPIGLTLRHATYHVNVLHVCRHRDAGRLSESFSSILAWFCVIIAVNIISWVKRTRHASLADVYALNDNYLIWASVAETGTRFFPGWLELVSLLASKKLAIFFIYRPSINERNQTNGIRCVLFYVSAFWKNSIRPIYRN